MGQTYFANDLMIVNFKDKIVIGQGEEQVTIWKSDLVCLLAFFDQCYRLLNAAQGLIADFASWTVFPPGELVGLELGHGPGQNEFSFDATRDKNAGLQRAHRCRGIAKNRTTRRISG